MSMDQVDSNSHCNIEKQIAQLMRCKPLSEQEGTGGKCCPLDGYSFMLINPNDGDGHTKSMLKGCCMDWHCQKGLVEILLAFVLTMILQATMLDSHYLSVFEELKFLGCGSSGCAILARHKLDGHEYAVKKIPIKKSDTPFHVLIREVEVMAMLHHPNIVRYHQAWVEAKFHGMQRRQENQIGISSASLELTDDDLASPCLYIQMEYCDRTLKGVLTSNSRVQNLKVLSQVVMGLKHIHSMRIVHGDLSRNNIFIGMDGYTKIADFGLSAWVDGDGHVLGPNSGGTLLYKAPEGATSLKADIFSLGILLFELLSNFNTESERISEISRLTKDGMFKTWESDLSTVLEEMISKTPEDRPSLDRVLESIQQVLHEYG